MNSSRTDENIESVNITGNHLDIGWGVKELKNPGQKDQNRMLKNHVRYFDHAKSQRFVY